MLAAPGRLHADDPDAGVPLAPASCATPASSPPPPTGTTTTSGARPSWARRSRRRRCPGPAIVRRSSNAGTTVAPVRGGVLRRRPRPPRRRCRRSTTSSTASPPSAAIRSRFCRGRGARARAPGRGCRAAGRRSATPWPWLPALAHTAPAARSAGVELGQQVVGAAQLVGAADLQVLPLEPDVRAGARPTAARCAAAGWSWPRPQPRGRGVDVLGEGHAPDSPPLGTRRRVPGSVDVLLPVGGDPPGRAGHRLVERAVGRRGQLGPADRLVGRGSPRTSPRRARSSARSGARCCGSARSRAGRARCRSSPRGRTAAHRRRCTHQPPAAVALGAAGPARGRRGIDLH